MLDRMSAEQFISLPYIDDELRHLIPNYCYPDQHIWGAKVPLICFHIVEYQKVDRIMHQFGYQQPIPENPVDIEADQTLHKYDLRERGVTDYHWLHTNHLAIWGMRYHLVQIGEVAYGVAHGHAPHTPEYNEWYRRISKRYLTPVGLIHAASASSYYTHSTSSSSMSSQRRRRSRTDVPRPSVSYERVDADVRPSDVYIPSPPHMSPPPYMASTLAMYQQLMLDFAQQSSEVFNSPIM
ncbi:Serine/threonine-protein phosphatase 7 long form-like [Quillaja saponaria]|uniref:Serine/threonine-protein phosphatase 7 long form-like n=1 Tax=Quillaja saponaria TaxID=32244 RepID=A0AAD7LKE0_QUISA|nr:Serine/threonine-protein phosphatase 7 long form-like [Quillaja saponaria]